MYFPGDETLNLDLKPGDLPQALANPNGLLWVDFSGETPEVCEPILEGVFGFHPLAVDDALSESHVPKLDDWQKYLYVVLDAIQFDRDNKEVDTIEVDVFLGKNYLVTHHDLSVTALDHAWSNLCKDERHHRHGADHLLYILSDELVADFMHAVEEIDTEIEAVENQVFDNPSPNTAQNIFTLKRMVVKLRRSISPLREVFNKLARDDFEVTDEKDRVYFRDIYDHLVRLHDISESLRDLVSGVLDTYLSVINNRMNEVMKTLTIITTVFMPISFLAGFFGMNFFVPEQPFPLSLWVTLPVYIPVFIIFVVAPVLMFWWFHRRGWM
jgi:magnesium transporter